MLKGVKKVLQSQPGRDSLIMNLEGGTFFL
jgi:hypothetical protein